MFIALKALLTVSKNENFNNNNTNGGAFTRIHDFSIEIIFQWSILYTIESALHIQSAVNNVY